MNIKSEITAKTLREMEKIMGAKLTLGKLLCAIREADDVSQCEFGQRLKMSRQQLCDIEHGRKPVSPGLAARYADILGYSREQFIRLSLQDLVDRSGLNVDVEIFIRRNKKNHGREIAA